MPEAEEDLKSIREYIAVDSSDTAQKIVLIIMSFVAEQLGTFPRSGRVGRVSDTYEVLVPKLPYCIPYRLKGGTVEILRVYHTSRRWPSKF